MARIEEEVARLDSKINELDGSAVKYPSISGLNLLLQQPALMKVSLGLNNQLENSMPLPFKQITDMLHAQTAARKTALDSHEFALKVELRSIERMDKSGTLSPEGKKREADAKAELVKVEHRKLQLQSRRDADSSYCIA